VYVCVCVRVCACVCVRGVWVCEGGGTSSVPYASTYVFARIPTPPTTTRTHTSDVNSTDLSHGDMSAVGGTQRLLATADDFSTVKLFNYPVLGKQVRTESRTHTHTHAHAHARTYTRTHARIGEA